MDSLGLQPNFAHFRSQHQHQPQPPIQNASTTFQGRDSFRNYEEIMPTGLQNGTNHCQYKYPNQFQQQSKAGISVPVVASSPLLQPKKTYYSNSNGNYPLRVPPFSPNSSNSWGDHDLGPDSRLMSSTLDSGTGAAGDMGCGKCIEGSRRGSDFGISTFTTNENGPIRGGSPSRKLDLEPIQKQPQQQSLVTPENKYDYDMGSQTNDSKPAHGHGYKKYHQTPNINSVLQGNASSFDMDSYKSMHVPNREDKKNQLMNSMENSPNTILPMNRFKSPTNNFSFHGRRRVDLYKPSPDVSYPFGSCSTVWPSSPVSRAQEAMGKKQPGIERASTRVGMYGDNSNHTAGRFGFEKSESLSSGLSVPSMRRNSDYHYTKSRIGKAIYRQQLLKQMEETKILREEEKRKELDMTSHPLGTRKFPSGGINFNQGITGTYPNQRFPRESHNDFDHTNLNKGQTGLPETTRTPVPWPSRYNPSSNNPSPRSPVMKHRSISESQRESSSPSYPTPIQSTFSQNSSTHNRQQPFFSPSPLPQYFPAAAHPYPYAMPPPMQYCPWPSPPMMPMQPQYPLPYHPGMYAPPPPFQQTSQTPSPYNHFYTQNRYQRPHRQSILTPPQSPPIQSRPGEEQKQEGRHNFPLQQRVNEIECHAEFRDSKHDFQPSRMMESESVGTGNYSAVDLEFSEDDKPKLLKMCQFKTSDCLPDRRINFGFHQAELKKQIDEAKKLKEYRKKCEREEEEKLERKILEEREADRRRFPIRDIEEPEETLSNKLTRRGDYPTTGERRRRGSKHAKSFKANGRSGNKTGNLHTVVRSDLHAPFRSRSPPVPAVQKRIEITCAPPVHPDTPLLTEREEKQLLYDKAFWSNIKQVLNSRTVAAELSLQKKLQNIKKTHY